VKDTKGRRYGNYLSAAKAFDRVLLSCFECCALGKLEKEQEGQEWKE